MLVPDNFKFKQLLEASGLSVSEKYDISSIFNVLSDDRKIDIIAKWPQYLNEILKIRMESLEKRRENISKALRNIDAIVSEAMLRKKDEEERKQRERVENTEVLKNAQTFDEIRRANALKNLINRQNDNNWIWGVGR